jgi:hypothetical protein
LRVGPASRTVDALQVERGSAKVGNCRGVDLAQQAGSRVEGYVVVEEPPRCGWGCQGYWGWVSAGSPEAARRPRP